MGKLARDHRNRELAQIHIAKTQLSMEDEDYRAMLWAKGRVRSAKDLDYAGRRAVIDHLVGLGFKITRGTGRTKDRPRNIDSQARGPQLKKIEALLASAGREWAYVHGMAKRMYQVDRVDLCHEGQLQGLIAALVKDQQRRAARAEQGAADAA
jgi:phage gp16-like protein